VSLSRRDRREWRIFLWISLSSAVISAYFGYAIAPPDSPSWIGVLSGVANSVLIATPITWFELKSERPGALRQLRRLPLAAYFSIKVVFYLVVIMASLLLVRLLVAPFLPPRTADDATLRNSIIFAVAMSLFANVTIEMGLLLGFGTLKNLLTGRYVQPKKEQMTFLLIDMKDSTGLAERLGPDTVLTQEPGGTPMRHFAAFGKNSCSPPIFMPVAIRHWVICSAARSRFGPGCSLSG